MRLAVAVVLISMTNPLSAAEPKTAIEFAQKAFRSGASPLMRWGIKSAPVEGDGPIRTWRAHYCVADSERAAFNELPLKMAVYCQQGGGTMVELGRCEVQSGQGPATWFTATMGNAAGCGPYNDATEMVVHEVNHDALSSTDAQVAWMTLGIKSTQERSFRQASAQRQTLVAEAERLRRDETALKTKGTQVCKAQSGGEFLGFVEDVSGNRIKVLVSAFYYGDVRNGRRSPKFAQEYIWSDVSEWRLC